ncbi:unnamed protein product [Tuber aestivum]|uniref:Fungal N-terminal domain-containing protein n=1 Tax=Tuber aestivum TaxID=59557 RepID=A0A292Q4L8_9PEZI|nr:unnamed protein product [Tuber aestivum]
MGLSVGIGDIVLLSQIAYKIALAFTSGRRSAPKEFSEVENQLFALSNALDTLSKEARTSGANPDTSPEEDHKAAESLGVMIDNCRTTLEGLDKIVQEYCPALSDGGIRGARRAEDGEEAEKLQKRKWSKKLKDNWKKVAWTMGDGDLSTLREKLTLHVTAITLVVSTLQSTKSTRLNEQFAKMQKTLEGMQLDRKKDVEALMERLPTSTNPIPEIGELVLHQSVNFMNCAPNVGSEIGSIIPGRGSPPVHGYDSAKKGYRNKPIFEISLEAEDGGLRVICARAAVNLEWVHSQQTSENSKRVRAFVCLCLGTGLSMVQFGNEVHEIHADQLEDLRLLPMSFATRLSGPRRQWRLYPIAHGQAGGAHQKITIRGVKAFHMSKFERKFISRLNINATLHMISQRETSMFVYFRTDEQPYRAVLLDCIADDSAFQKHLRSITYTPDAAAANPEPVAVEYHATAVQILSYKTVQSGCLQRGMAAPVDFFEHVETGELVIYLAPDEVTGAEHKVYIYFTYDTAVEEVEGIPRRALIKDVRGCSTRGESITGNVEIRFSRPGAAKNFRTKVEEMTQELYIQTLLRPLAHERVLRQMYVGDVVISSRSILDAEVIFTEDEAPPAANRKRILIRSLSGSCYYCQEVLSEGPRPGSMGRLSEAVIVEMTDPRQLMVFGSGAYTRGQLGIEFDMPARKSSPPCQRPVWCHGYDEGGESRNILSDPV